MYHQRRRIAVTTQGRIGFYKSDLSGNMSERCFPLCCFKGGLRCTNHVEIQWFHASDVSAMQMTVGEANGICPPWNICRRSPYAVRLRMWFDKYPSLAQMNGTGTGNISAVRTALPAKKWRADVPRGLFESVVNTGASCLAKALCLHRCIGDGAGGAGGSLLANMDPSSCFERMCGCAAEADTVPYPGSRKPVAYEYDIVSGQTLHLRDDAHPDRKEQEDSIRKLYETVMAVSSNPTGAAVGTASSTSQVQVQSGPLTHFTGPDDGRPHFNIVHQSATLLDRSGLGIPIVNVPARDLIPGEQVVDALPYVMHQSWFEFCCSMCNCCFLCPPSFNGAMVLTSHRIITYFIDSRAAARGDGSNRSGNLGLCSSQYLMVMESLSLGSKGFQEGLLGLGARDAAILVRTGFGGIKITSQLRRRYPWQCSTNTNIRTRARLFLSNFVSRNGKQILATPPQGFNAGVPQDIQSVLPLMPGEAYVASMRSEGLFLNLADYYNPITVCASCNNDLSLVKCVRCCTCGCKPLEHVAHVVLTTHRLLAVGFPENKPCLFKSCCSQRGLIIFWQPLKTMPGFKVNGTLSVEQSCIAQTCSCMPCFSPGSAYSTTDAAGLKGFPVPIQRFVASTNEGILEEPQVAVLRRAMSLVTAAPGLDPSVNLAALAQGPGAGAGAGAPVM